MSRITHSKGYRNWYSYSATDYDGDGCHDEIEDMDDDGDEIPDEDDGVSIPRPVSGG